MLPGEKRGKQWARTMQAIEEAAAAEKAAEDAKKAAEDAKKAAEDAEKAAVDAAAQVRKEFLALLREEQFRLTYRVWRKSVDSSRPVRAEEALAAENVVLGEENMVRFVEEPTVMKVPNCLLQSSDPWKYKKASQFGPDMEYPVAPPLALLRAARLAAELSR